MNKANTRKLTIISIILSLAAGSLLLNNCFSPYQGDGTILTITAPGNGSGYARFLPELEIVDLVHTIRLHNGSGPDQEKTGIKAGQAESFNVTPGRWTITIEAFNVAGIKRAEASRTVTVNPGQNNPINLTMGPPSFGVNSWAELLAEIVSGDGPQIFILRPNNDDLTAWHADSTINIDREITLVAEGDVTILRDENNINFFTVSQSPAGTLTFGRPGGMASKLTLDGNKGSFGGNTESLISVSGYSDGFGGKLEMYGNIILTNNYAYRGGGVQVSGGTFNMHGGTISYNKAEHIGGGGYGGGVAVEGGIFFMSGGSIEYNEALQIGGGGVYVGATGSIVNFVMSGGTISDNTATQGSGVALGFPGTPRFTMSGSARVNDEVYLTNGSGPTYRQIIVGGPFTNQPTGAVAYIRPETTTVGTKVLTNLDPSNDGEGILGNPNDLVFTNYYRFELASGMTGGIDNKGLLE